MNKIFTALLVLATVQCGATNYYISSSGNDANAGTVNAPWKTIARANSQTYAANDSVLLRRGDVFYGTLRINRNTINVDAYGTGAKPIITGFTTVTGWTGASGKYWAGVAGIKPYCNIVLIDNYAKEKCRTPNTGFWYYSAATTSTLTYSLLSGQPSFVGGQAIMIKNGYRADIGRITTQTTSSITYTATKFINPDPNASSGQSFSAGTADYGFYVQNSENCLDAFGEWRVDSTAGTLRIFLGSNNPASYSIQASTVDTLLNCGNFQTVSIKNIKFTGANIYAVYMGIGANPNVKDCDFENNTMAVTIYNSNNAVVEGNSFKHSFCNAVTVQNRQRYNITIRSNTVDSTGMMLGHGLWAFGKQLKGIYGENDSTRTSNTMMIELNTVTNTGHAGIEFQGTNVTVRKNFVKNFLLKLEDNGGVYTFTNNTGVPNKVYTNRQIYDNTIIDCSGAVGIRKTSKPDVAGLYLDDQSRDILAYNNTVANIDGPGIQLNNPLNITMRSNTIFDCPTGINVKAKNIGTLSGNHIKSNIFFSTDTTQVYLWYEDYNLALPSVQTLSQSVTGFATIDSNYIHCNRNNKIKISYSVSGGTTINVNHSLSSWQSTYSQDVHSSIAPVTVTTYDLSYNATPYGKTDLFPAKRKRNMKNQVFDEQNTIPAWSSEVYIDDGSSPTPEPPDVEDPVINGFILVNWILQ